MNVVCGLGRGWLVLLMAAVFAPAAGAQPRDPMRVAATVGMVADIVRQVGGDRVDVAGLIGEGVDPHLYKPTRGDVAQLLAADLVFFAGLFLEGKMADTLEKVGQGGKPVHAVTQLIDEAYLLRPDPASAHHDPHVWMDIQAWMKCVGVVARELAAFDPDHGGAYHDRAAAYLEELQAMHEYARQALATIPEQSRVLITAHDAFNYFGRAYGLEVRGIQGISTESEAGLSDINRLVDLIVERDVRAVFVETSVADKNVRALVEGARARGREVVVGGNLYSDAMGPAGTYEGTYIGMMDHNVTVITRALGGTAPACGRHGKLAP